MPSDCTTKQAVRKPVCCSVPACVSRSRKRPYTAVPNEHLRWRQYVIPRRFVPQSGNICLFESWSASHDSSVSREVCADVRRHPILLILTFADFQNASSISSIITRRQPPWAHTSWGGVLARIAHRISKAADSWDQIMCGHPVINRTIATTFASGASSGAAIRPTS